MDGRWAEWLPWPLVGVSVLLAVLIFLTPNLLSAGTGAAAGSLEVQAELTLYRAPQANGTELYVHGLGLVPYAALTLQLAPWNATAFTVPSNWTTTIRANHSLALVAETFDDPFVVNVTAVYTDPAGATEWYLGAFVVQATTDTLYVTPLLAGVAPVNPTPIDALPLSLLLTGSSTEAGS